MKGAKGKTIHQLMLKDTEYSTVLHKMPMDSIDNAIEYCNALDFVISKWVTAMGDFDVEGIDSVSEQAYGSLMMLRMYFSDLKSAENLENYLDVIKAFNHFSLTMAPLSKSYAQTPVLSCWYASLPLILQRSYTLLRKNARRMI
tara:strand:- start:314 stop:745 length:432 start_codon:yes stop_codon:yes gene_type:complete